jgi:hypothetical protein
MRAIGEIAPLNAPGPRMRARRSIVGKSMAAKLNGGVTEVTERVHLCEIAVIFAAAALLPHQGRPKKRVAGASPGPCRREVAPI